ncbi:hypothetical protein EPUS_04749 [Endocarpon pusillum Z07020]|uniref:Uncharacterized protein n=1 Tax=Endocarpon pusillum (strain Z07020 / HMAS-L-300199) TaxID=1263415 RepID=U1GFE8_ENDPU|nr:uncharacterized protein EPUS_04749 [Endocarpon pusillum Z07020]ERF70471.1 hypothetical protein EPUS_04749 [Endocarpon pusillum Z07020]
MDDTIETVEQPIEPKPAPPKLKTGIIPQRTMAGSKTNRTVSSKSKSNPSTDPGTKSPSAAAARTTTGSTLNKPPTRPTAGSTLRKTTASSTNAATSHQPRASISIVDESTKSVTSGDDMKSKPALGAPKRLSVAGPTNTSRSAPEKKPINQPPIISERKTIGRASAASPTKTSRPPSAASRPTTKSSVSSLRAAGVVDVKKRLSTFPASPTSRHVIKQEEEKENRLPSIPASSKGKGLVRPSLGTRQSTRSAALQQKIREYELVNEMLQAAMAAEDAGDDDQKENLTTEVGQAIIHLKANLEVTEEASSAEKSTMIHQSAESMSILESQLQDSKATIESLKQEVEELRARKVDSASSAQIGGGDAKSEAESISLLHIAEVDKLKKEYELEISSLHQKLQELKLEQQERAEQSIKELEDAKKTALEAGDTKMSQLLEEQKSIHSKAVQALENDLALERKAIKESADKVSLLQQEIEQHKRDLATATSHADEYRKTIKARQDEIATRERELQGRGDVIKSLQDEIVALQQAKIDEAAGLKQSSAKRVAELEVQIATLRSAIDRSSEESALSEERTQEELVRKEQEISKLGQVIERLQSEVQSVHESKSNELDVQLLKIRQEHDQIIMALKAEHQLSIDGLAKSHNHVVEKLSDEARNNRTAHERQIQELNNQKSDIQKSLEDAMNSLKDSQAETGKQMQELELKHNEACRAANEKVLKAEKDLAESQQLLEQVKEDAERATSEKMKTLEEKTQALEDQSCKDAAAIKDARSELEAAQEQVETLKQAMMTIEKESQGKEEHHTNTLKKAIAEAEAATKSLSENSARLASAEADHVKAVKDLRSSHEAELGHVRNELTQKHDTALQELKAKHDELLASQKNLEKTQKDELEQIKAEHERGLDDSAKKIVDLQQTHLQKIEEVKRQATDEHFETLKQLEEEFSKKAAETEHSHNVALDNLQSTHEMALLVLRVQLQDNYVKSDARAKESHDAIVNDLQAQLDRLKDDLAKAQLEVKKASEPREDPELEKLRSNLQASNDALAAAQSEAARLANDVEDMKQQLDQDQKTITMLENAAREASKTRENTSSREAHKLREQLDGALQEAETQRASSDIANEEFRESTERLKQYKTRIDELEARLQAVNEKPDVELKISTPNSARKRKGYKGSKNSPRLSQGSWGPEQENREVAGSPVQEEGGENFGSSIQGSMASIREQLRQLDEVNEDMLEGHARMANMLSNVPESPIPSPSTTTTAG